jgi:hypothetical protein
MDRFVVTILALLACGLASVAQEAISAGPSTATPALDGLSKFTANDVPTTGPAERPLGQLASTNPVLTNLPGKGLAQHPMLFIGEGYNKMFVVRNGIVIWTYSTGVGGEYDDAWMLSNGNIVYSRMDYAEEITPQKKVVWHFDPEKGAEIHTIQPIGLDKVFFVQNGTPPKLMIVNTKTKAVEVSHDLVSPNGGGPGGVHGQFRRARVTAAGTYLLSWMGFGKVVEYDKNFKQIWSYNMRSPWAAVRLHNGNTLITNEGQELTREVNPKGETVWEFKLADLPAELKFHGCQTCTRLANGNTVFCSRGDGGKGSQLVEITPEKKVVWALYDWKHLGPATAVQMLDDPGVPENPGDLQR